MKDICGNDIDIQGLLLVAQATEERPPLNFDMDSWLCGTTACMIGSFCEKHYNDKLKLRWQPEAEGWAPVLPDTDLAYTWAVAVRFGVSIDASEWLFVPREYMSQKQALARLRKFIYYKLHKAELLADYETARATGDAGIAEQVTESLTKEVNYAVGAVT